MIIYSHPEHRPPADIRALLFDLDNTLFDRDQAFGKWAHDFVEEQFHTESQARREAILEEFVALDAGGRVTKQWLFSRIRTRYPTVSIEVDALCERFYQEWLVHMEMEAETLALLDRLEQAGIPFGIVTNGPVQQHLKIRRLALQDRTQCLFVSEEFGGSKPDPAIFRAAAACLDVPCDQILFVGDNPEADICGAHGVGMKTAWLHRGTAWPDHLAAIAPDYILDAPADLASLLW